MNYAILAAGEGSRLKDEGISTPKPLVKINSIPLIERLIRVFIKNNAKSVSVIVNYIYPEVEDFLRKLEPELGIKLNIVRKDTPSSLHSFYELKHFLFEDDFCLTTVDTIFDSKEFSEYIDEFKNSPNLDGLMAVTSHVDDEKPLFVETDKKLNIKGFHDFNNGKCQYISGGVYCMRPIALKTLWNAYNTGMSRMRNLQREFLVDGLKLKAYPFSKILDIDHAEDIAKAEKFLTGIEN